MMQFHKVEFHQHRLTKRATLMVVLLTTTILGCRLGALQSQHEATPRVERISATNTPIQLVEPTNTQIIEPTAVPTQVVVPTETPVESTAPAAEATATEIIIEEPSPTEAVASEPTANEVIVEEDDPLGDEIEALLKSLDEDIQNAEAP